MKIKKWSGSAWVQEYPEVDVNNIVATGTPSSSTFLRGDGQWISVDSGNQFVNITGDTMTGNLQVGLTSADYKTILGTNALQFDRDGTSYIDQKGTGDLMFRFGSGYAARMTLTNDGKLGIGDTTPSYSLEVAGDMAVNKIFDRNNGSYYLDPASTSVINALNVQRLEVEGAIFDTENDQLRMPFPKGGYYTNGSSNVTGAIEITLPSGTHGNYSMISFFVDVFDYNGGADGESFTMHLGGYVNGTTWTHTFANMVTVGRTDRFFNVRYNVDGTANKIYIAETTNNWSYPKIQIRDFMAGHSGADDADWYNNAFTIDITTTIDGTTAREKTLESVATWADQVDVNSSSSSSYYNVLWHSGDTVYYAANNKLRVQPSTGNLQIDGDNVETEEFASTYTAIPSNGWNDYALGRGIFSRSTSTGLPSGGTHGYWLILGRRDVSGGYAGIYVNDYSTSGSGVYIGRNDSGGNPTWEKVWTDKTDGNGSGLSADNLRGYVPQESASANSIAKRDGNGDLKASKFIDGSNTSYYLDPASTSVLYNIDIQNATTFRNDVTLDHDGTGTAADSHGIVFTARAAAVDFTKELLMDDEGDLVFNGNALATEAYVTANAGGTLDTTLIETATSSNTTVDISGFSSSDAIVVLRARQFAIAPPVYVGKISDITTNSTYKHRFYLGSTQLVQYYRSSTQIIFSSFATAVSVDCYELEVA